MSPAPAIRRWRLILRGLFYRIRRIRLRPDIQSWKDLLRDSRSAWRTAIGLGIGALIGGMPILGVHTWIATGMGAVLPLPPLSVLVGSNISNPLTFLPITYVEIRVGQLLLGRTSGFSWDGFSVDALGTYWLEAWFGFIVVGPLMGIVTAVAVRAVLATKEAS